MYKRQILTTVSSEIGINNPSLYEQVLLLDGNDDRGIDVGCLLYTSDAADERSSVDLGGRRIIKKKTNRHRGRGRVITQ